MNMVDEGFACQYSMIKIGILKSKMIYQKSRFYLS